MAQAKSNLETIFLWAVIIIALIIMMGGVIVKKYKSQVNITSQNSSSRSNIAEGEPAPDFDVKTLDGRRVRLSSSRGKVVILDFWSITCGPCVDANKHLQKLYDRYGKMNLEVVGLSIDRAPEMVENFLKTHPVEYSMGMATDQIIKDYGGVFTLPQTYIIGRDGKIVRKYEGYSPLTAHQMETLIKKLLSKG